LRWVGNENAMAPLPHWYAVPNGKCSMKTDDGKQQPYIVIISHKEEFFYIGLHTPTRTD